MNRAPVLSVDPERPDPEVLARAAEILRAGGLVAFPTETVYGLGADARSSDAVRRIFTAKARPGDNPLIVHLADAAELDAVAALVTPLARRLADAHWPGPLTLVLEAAPGLAPEVTAGLTTVGLRVPDHAVARALVAAAGVPLAAPSANRSGRPSPTTAAHVRDDLGERVDLILDAGPCAVGVESTVVDARGAIPVVLREGGITRERLGAVTDPRDETALGASPGTRHPHYRPACAVELAEPGQAAALAAALAATLAAARRADGVRVGLVAREAAPEGVVEVARFDDAAELAEQLYTALRAAEAAGVELLVVEAVAEEGIGRAVMDRLRRAAGQA